MTACTPLTREAPARELGPSTVTVTASADLPVIPANPDRRSVLIVNTSTTASVYIVKGRQGRIGDFSYELLPGEGVTTTTAGPIYIVTVSGSVVVKCLAELGAV